MQINATIHSSTLSIALMSIELVSPGFATAEPVVASVWASAAPANSGVARLTPREQQSARTRFIPFPHLFRSLLTTKPHHAAGPNVSDRTQKIAQARCQSLCGGMNAR